MQPDPQQLTQQLADATAKADTSLSAATTTQQHLASTFTAVSNDVEAKQKTLDQAILADFAELEAQANKARRELEELGS